jgi:transposase
MLRYLDACQYETYLEVYAPRIKCKKDGVQQIAVPFAEKHSRFERAVLVWLHDSPISAVAENLKLSWDEVEWIMWRAVKRGLERRKQTKPENIGIDETSFKKRHDYVTVVVDKDRWYVMDMIFGRDAEALEQWFRTQKNYDLSEIQSISINIKKLRIKNIIRCNCIKSE